MNTAHRAIIALQCTVTDFVAHYRESLTHLEALCVSDADTTAIKCIPFTQALTRLGQEVDILIFDMNESLAVNALGALSGCVRGGGAMIILLPLDTEALQSSRFYRRFQRILSSHQVTIATLQNAPELPALNNANQQQGTDTVTPTTDQSRAIQAVIKVVTGHRNRPLVLTSDRGRGKSSALGMAVNQLLSTRTLDVIVTAPAKAMVAPLFAYAGQHDNLHYIAPDELISRRPKAGLLIIDEAGAIPIPILSRLLKHYSRIVFSTTLHGYEGNGRGFAIRFYDQLQQHTPDWQHITLEQPIRWGANDPLEQLIHHLLLLNAEPATLSNDINLNAVVHQTVSQDALLENEALLNQLYGLFVIAHYQTRPADLLQLLDSQQLSVHALFSGPHLVGAAIVSHEGGLDHELALAIYRGERRPKGHLIPQILLSQMGMLAAASLKTDRIMRIAVHPTCRRQGLASQLLQTIANQSTADYLSTSFGLSETLWVFWKQAAFTPVYLGLKREASSGYHSAALLRPLTQTGAALTELSAQSFSATLVAQLGDSLKDYDPYLAFLLLANCQQRPVDLYPQEIQDIKRFTRRQCRLGSALAGLQRWLPTALINDKQTIKNNEAQLLIMRILQHHNWSHCCEMLGIPGKQVAQQTLQQTASVLAKQLPDMDQSTEG